MLLPTVLDFKQQRSVYSTLLENASDGKGDKFYIKDCMSCVSASPNWGIGTAKQVPFGTKNALIYYVLSLCRVKNSSSIALNQ